MPDVWASWTGPLYSGADFDYGFPDEEVDSDGSDSGGGGGGGENATGGRRAQDVNGDAIVNFWYEEFERVGPNAEDGISGSGYQSRSVEADGSQMLSDGVGGYGHLAASGFAGDGYITDPHFPACHGDTASAAVKLGNTSDKCYRINNRPWTKYDPYHDRYTASGAPYDTDAASRRNTYEECTPVGHPYQQKPVGEFANCTAAADASLSFPQPNRGFKGIGPAYTEPENAYACTIHSRECRNDVLGDGQAFWGAEFYDEVSDTFQGGWTPGAPEPVGVGEGTDGSNTQCVLGSFQVRLNSSPGTKHVQRQYLGEPVLVVEEELITVVIRPDVTPQTVFDPPSVTFTHTGGRVNGYDTYRWDEPATIKVVPVDDKVDERAGVTIDFTSFTITQSHFGDSYWDYTVPYQLHPNVGTMYVAQNEL
eukprot:SAG22_NODE_4456_length_1263_cov_1.107388_1_plen_421_part_11